MMKTRSLMMKKCRNLKNEIKTRWGDSMNLLYCSHIINKSRRSFVKAPYLALGSVLNTHGIGNSIRERAGTMFFFQTTLNIEIYSKS